VKRQTLFLALLVAFLLAPRTGYSQSIQERLLNFGTDFAKGYMGPFVDAFGASLNSGWYHTANVDNGISLYLGVKVMYMPIPDDRKTFTIESPYPPLGTFDTVPTVFGENVQKPISGGGAFPIDKYPAGLNYGFAPMIVPQAQVGNIMGTRAILRYFPKMAVGDIGDIEFFGIGVQHSVSQYIPMVPIDISALVAYQSFKLGSMINTTAYTFGAQISKSLAVLTLYGGLAYEKSTMSFGYDAELPDPSNFTLKVKQHIGFDADGKNSFRATVGASLDLLVFKIHADYSLASQPVATLGVGIGF